MGWDPSPLLVEGVFSFCLYLCNRLGRIVAIDYGVRRCGLATTDPLRIAVSSLAGVETAALMDFLVNYTKSETVDRVVIGIPGSPTVEFDRGVKLLVRELAAKLPDVEVETFNEDFSSQRAQQMLLQMGIKKSSRQRKDVIDAASAVVILQEYLGY